MKAYYVTWEEHFEEQPYLCSAIGYLLDEKKDFITLAPAFATPLPLPKEGKLTFDVLGNSIVIAKNKITRQSEISVPFVLSKSKEQP